MAIDKMQTFYRLHIWGHSLEVKPLLLVLSNCTSSKGDHSGDPTTSYVGNVSFSRTSLDV